METMTTLYEILATSSNNHQRRGEISWMNMVKSRPIRSINQSKTISFSKMFDDNDDTPVTLSINKYYANKYQTWREKEEKQKCRHFVFILMNMLFVVLVIARYGSDVEDDSDEESEDENAEVKINEMFSLFSL